MIFVKACSAYIFLRSFKGFVFLFRSLIYLEFVLVCFVRKYSKFILIFIVQRTSTLPSTVAVTNFHSQHPYRMDTPFSIHPLQHLLLVEFLSMAILTGVR